MYYRVLGPFINLVHSVPPGKETQVSCQRRNPFFSSPLPHEDQMLSLVQRFLSTDFWDNKGPSLLRNKGFIVYYDQFLLFWSRKRDVVFWVHMDLFKLLGKLIFWKKKFWFFRIWTRDHLIWSLTLYQLRYRSRESDGKILLFMNSI